MIKIIFENENICVCDKPSNCLSTPSRFKENDVRSCLGLELEKKLNKKIYPVHRLDYEVSGLIIYAKNKNAQTQLTKAFEDKKIFKKYHAITTKNEEVELPKLNEKFTWNLKILRGKKRSFISEYGKDSLTYAEVEKIISETGSLYGAKRTYNQSKKDFIFWNLNPVTGRPHQLRFTLSYFGYPILGDKLYGSNFQYKEGIALRCVQLKFTDESLIKVLKCPTSFEVLGLSL
jgi:tRNA pseudouridine32 synthase/23S rRNA pseudouridine746 synthase